MRITVCFLAVISFAFGFPSLEKVEFDFSKVVTNHIYREPKNHVDSKSVNLPGSRIIGGTEVTPNSLPYQAALLINGGSLCGGSLISVNHVLTAAHCTFYASFVEVRLGAHYFNQNEDNQIRITSSNLINHEDYNDGSSFVANDVAIIVLPAAVELNINIQVIPLASPSDGDYEGSTAVLSGWGRTSDSSSVLSQVLLSVNVDVISNDECETFYADDVAATNICTSGAGTVGACNGDSGSPLVVDGVQVGIVSFGSNNCESGGPTVYARITSFSDWVTGITGV